jgi:outer membrane lipopolysaccharide assembly protein LptE/RlpB
MKIYQKLLAVIIGQLFLSSCGFTTYNINSFPPQLRQIYYQTDHPNEPFEISLKKRLKSANVNLLNEPVKSSPILNVGSGYSSAVNNPSATNQARVYNLNYNATVTISDFFGKKLIGPQVVSVARTITLQPNEAFEATSQTTLVKREMQQELIIKVLNILTAPKTFQALKK